MTASSMRGLRRRRIHPQLLVLIALAAALVLLLQELGSRIDPPPVTSWAALSRWYEEAPLEVAAVAVLRLVALTLAGWLLVASTLQVLVALPGLRAVGRVADLISPRSLQRLGHGLAGLSLTAGLPAVAPGAGIPVTFALPVVTASPPGDDDAELRGDEQGTARMRLLGDVAATPALTSAPSPSFEVTVQAGDSFWSIAADELAERGGAPASERLIVPYWRRLIEQNRRVLVDPRNPDLLYPGQVVTLPPA